MADEKTLTNEELLALLADKDRKLAEQDEAIQSLTSEVVKTTSNQSKQILTILKKDYEFLYPKIVFGDKEVDFETLQKDPKLAEKLLKEQDGSLVEVIK